MEEITFSELAYDMLLKDEGLRPLPYDDATGKPPAIKGKLTIGVGRNLTDRGLSQDEIEYLFRNDLKIALNDAIFFFPNIATYSIKRQLAIVNLTFNLGRGRFSPFHATIKAIREENWVEAALHLQDSLWFVQVKDRGPRVIKLLTHEGDPYGWNK